MPVGMPYLLGNKEVDWCYRASRSPTPTTASRRCRAARRSAAHPSINAMCYIRGHARDYDIWRQLGNVGWSWDDVLPYFKRSRNIRAAPTTAHGTDGELGVQENRAALGDRRGLEARRDRLRHSGDRRPQRRRQRRRRVFPGHHPQRPPLVGGAGVPASGDGSAQPARHHRGACQADCASRASARSASSSGKATS